jgi:catechol 2,3-dioxygenase-like lactoylglutathione lyase family enzyme
LTKKVRSFYSRSVATPYTSPRTLRPAQGIDHVTVGVRGYRAAKRFYERALRPLGFSVLLDWPDAGRAYLGLDSQASCLWLTEGRAARTDITLAAADRASVDSFYAAALAAGGTAVSAPAVRPEYTASTYSARVLDPDGNSVEAICRGAAPHASEAAA